MTQMDGTIQNLDDRVRSAISFLGKKELARGAERIADLIALRLEHGWSFTGATRERHEKNVTMIREEVLRQLAQM